MLLQVLTSSTFNFFQLINGCLLMHIAMQCAYGTPIDGYTHMSLTIWEPQHMNMIIHCMYSMSLMRYEKEGLTLY